ncbi:DUF2779 domain-containing protein [Fodinibius sediminis]|uniref:DUF2779 domain-containing protein n=1 Tax=Fodinibius sediminis TaxID=1214077 RepID=A0A521EMZ5_9BACT|nr:DUF2779 domain-containing protein [Fodinibius sediminis]SMO85297.1 protein of unknown function [Fodinibius sediminis]
MKQGSEKARYFTKHLFRAGLECPTKLFYKSQDYPENSKALPFIRHAVYNKKLLKSLVRSVHSEGVLVEGDSVRDSAARTGTYLMENRNITLFDPVFVHRRMMAKVPVLVKNGDQLTILHVQSKAFSSRKHQLLKPGGGIHSRWRKYLLDFAYQLYILKQEFPDFSLLPLLVLPDKSGAAHTDSLPALLNTSPGGSPSPAVPAPNQQLLAKLDVSTPVTMIWEDPSFAENHLPKRTFGESLGHLRDLYLQGTKVPPSTGYQCKGCEFNITDEQRSAGKKSGFRECWQPDSAASPDQKMNHVFELIGPGTRQLIEREVFYQHNINIDRQDIHSVASIAEDNGHITEKMRRALQIHKARGAEVPKEIMRASLRKELRRWQYPVHFLDFEAGNYAVPIRAGRPPYHLVVFQFSCHTLYKDGHWQHHQWIDRAENDYPNYELVRRLMQVPDINEGTIVQYSNFERNALKVIGRELRDEASMVPDSQWLLQWIDGVLRRNDSRHPNPPYLADLSRQVKHFYYNREMENSLSIKEVLQSVMSQSDFLKQKYSKPYSSQNFEHVIWWQADKDGKAKSPYAILKETGSDTVRRGAEAMFLYGKLIAGDLSMKEKSAYREALLRYCELDTLAMLMIVEHWKQQLNEVY